MDAVLMLLNFLYRRALTTFPAFAPFSKMGQSRIQNLNVLCHNLTPIFVNVCVSACKAFPTSFENPSSEQTSVWIGVFFSHLQDFKTLSTGRIPQKQNNTVWYHQGFRLLGKKNMMGRFAESHGNVLLHLDLSFELTPFTG